ncbi:ParB N-terminal domain-containing protein [Nocardia sp. NPDC049190]|uniref:ParB/RepB/Spo0J family partition protein n=1 Tax=Nocardia sp. NPDC049190 TaxID=3155650 RepID=UPI003400958A
MSSTTLTVVTDPVTNPDTDPAAVDVDETAETSGIGEPTAVEDTGIIDLPEPEAIYMNPAELVIADNVRRSFDIADHPKQADSIREFGVRAPVLAVREADGSVHVYDGQVRTLIAREVGCPRVPVWITDADAEVDEKERRIARTIDQINLNDRRIPLTDSDRAAGVALTLELGASATRVARGLQRKRSEIQKTAAVGKSETAKQLLDDGQYSLDQLAVIAHYENLGDTDAVERLLGVGRWNFTMTAKRIEHDRAETRARLEASLLHGAYGFGVLATEPDTASADPEYIPATELAAIDGAPVSQEQIYTDPTRWVVYLEVEENGLLVETCSGAIIDPHTIEWDTQDNTAAEPSDGLRHADQVERRDRWTPSYFLPAALLADSGLQQRTPDNTDDSANALAAAEQAANEREQARDDRRRVIELNKRGQAAKERREEFLIKLVAGRTPPVQAAAFVGESIARKLDPAVLHKVTKLLGAGGSTEQLVAAIHAAPTNRAWMIVLAMEIAAAEVPIGKSLWRDGFGFTKRYLHFLAEVGTRLDFALVDVEQAAAADIDYRDIDLAF